MANCGSRSCSDAAFTWPIPGLSSTAGLSIAVTHQPPELLREGLLTSAADVWAFGVLLWSVSGGVGCNAFNLLCWRKSALSPALQ